MEGSVPSAVPGTRGWAWHGGYCILKMVKMVHVMLCVFVTIKLLNIKLQKFEKP